jgi:hypothetical protein
MFVAFFTDLIGTMTNYIGEAYEPDELVFFGALGFGATYIVAKLLVWLITKY